MSKFKYKNVEETAKIKRMSEKFQFWKIGLYNVAR